MYLHIYHMYNWIKILWIHNVHEFYIEQQIQIVLDSPSEEWNKVWNSLKQILSMLSFETLSNEMLLERERLYAHMSRRRTSRSANFLDSISWFITWYDVCKRGGHN